MLTREDIAKIARCRDSKFSAETLATYFDTDEIVIRLIWEIIEDTRPHLTLVRDEEAERCIEVAQFKINHPDLFSAQS